MTQCCPTSSDLHVGWPTTVQPTVLKPYYNCHEELSVEGDCLLWGMIVVVLRKLQAAVLHELHLSHPGITCMKSLAHSYVWWPNLDAQIEEVAKSCSACQSLRQEPSTAPLHPWIWPKQPWQRIHLDLAGPFLGKNFFSHSRCAFEMA